MIISGSKTTNHYKLLNFSMILCENKTVSVAYVMQVSDRCENNSSHDRDNKLKLSSAKLSKLVGR